MLIHINKARQNFKIEEHSLYSCYVMSIFRQRVYRYIVIEALKSRALLIVLQFISNVIVTDHKPDVFHFTKTREHYGIADKVVFLLLGGFLRWDAHYFVHISIYGYTYENSVAFFPFLPILIGVIAKFFHNFLRFISIEALILFFYVFSNSIIFILAAIALYRLTNLIFDDLKLAYKAVLLFCYNPASIFFIAPYTECLYSFLSFEIMLSCLSMYQKYEQHAFKFSLKDGKIIILIWCSTLTRSNGILNIGFLIFALICLMKITISSKTQIHKITYVIKYIVIIFTLVVLSIIPFCLYQFFCYKMFCTDFSNSLPKNVQEYGMIKNFVFPGEFSKHNQTWCHKQIPLAYSYVQDQYWNVGFLRYYKIKQIPNFMIATPIIVLLLKYTSTHLRENSKKMFQIFSLKSSVCRMKHMNLTIFDPALNVFVLHVLVLLFVCISIIHIQVSTRMLCSSSPVLYWYCSQYLGELSTGNTCISFFSSFKSKSELLLKSYFFGYFLIGTMLFSNFLPWT